MKKKIFAFVLMLILLNSSVLLSWADSDIVIVSPSAETVYCDDLLISIKVLEGKSLKISLYSINKNKSNLVFGPETFVSDSKLKFYTAQLDDIEKGLYKMVIETTDSDGKPEKMQYMFTVKDKSEKEAESEKILESKPSGTLQFVQNVLKSIFQ